MRLHSRAQRWLCQVVQQEAKYGRLKSRNEYRNAHLSVKRNKYMDVLN